MGFFDAFADCSFKKVDDRWLYFPWGVLGRGYVIPSEGRYEEIHRRVKRHFQISILLPPLIGVVLRWSIWGLVLVIGLVSLWYLTKIRPLARGLAASTERITIGESTRTVARGLPAPLLWLIEFGFLILVAAGIAAVIADTERWLLVAPLVVLFGAGAAVYGYMIVVRRRER